MPRLIITVPGKKPQPYRLQLDRQLTRFGRGSENDIVINCPSVSVHHAEMERVEGGFRLRDLESTNGTKLEGKRSKLVALREDQDITLGDVSFEFQLSEEERDALALEKPIEDSPIVSESTGEKLPDIDDDDEKPRPKKSRREERPEKPVESASQPGVMVSFLLTLLFFALVLAAFVGGMEIHHRKITEKATGHPRSLIQEMMDHRFAQPAPAPAPASEDAPAGAE